MPQVTIFKSKTEVLYTGYMYVMYGVENYRLVTMLMFSFLQGYSQNPGLTHAREALYHKLLPSVTIITQSWCSSRTFLNRSVSYPLVTRMKTTVRLKHSQRF